MKAVTIVILAGAGRARHCYGKHRKCAGEVIARVQYVYPYTVTTFGACAEHANRNERNAPIQESAS